MRAPLLGTLLALATCDAVAQPGAVPCPTAGTLLAFSNGVTIEAVSDRGNYVCRFQSHNTWRTRDVLLGVFFLDYPLFQANADKLLSLAPLQVGRKVSFTTSGAGSRGADGTWFIDVSIESAGPLATAAGVFATFAILYDEQTPQSTRGRWQYRYWYAPDIGYAVKFEHRTLQGMPPPNYPKDWHLTAIYPPAGPAPSRASSRGAAGKASP